MSNKLIISSETFSFSDISTHPDGDIPIVIKGEVKKVVNIDSKIKIILYYINGDREQYITKADLCTAYQLNAVLHNDGVILEERRRYYKLKVNLASKIIHIMNENKEILLEEEIPVTIKDINIGGVFIECSKNCLNVNDCINLEINLHGNEMILFSKVLRIQNSENNSYGYGCCFIHLTTKQEEIIAKFINQIQRERMDEIKMKLEKR